MAGTPKGAAINVVLFTSLLNTAQPVDLSAPGALNDPAVALNTLAAQRLLPDCSGWRVYAIGGDQQSQPPLDNASRRHNCASSGASTSSAAAAH